MSVLQAGLLNQSSAQVIDGSLKFDATAKTHLTRTVPNITIFTLSFWYKTDLVNRDEFFDTASSTGFYFYRDGQIKINNNSTNIFTSNGYYRDPNSFYHVVLNSDGSNVNLYVNGVLDKSTSIATQLYSGTASISSSHATDTADYHLSQYYLIDGQALTPESFGFTDPLTNTWRPKKYTRGVFEELDKFNTDTWTEVQNQLRYQGIKFPSSAGGTVAWKATGSSNTGLNLYTSTDNSNWTRRLTNQTVDSTNGLVYESSDQYVILVNGSDTNWSNQLQLFSDVNGATIHYSNVTYPGNGDPTMSWSGPGYTDGTIDSNNSVYLPFDGNSLIGEDKSGNGNDWTPVNFGGSNSLEKATGAKPILNTTQGGTQAGVGVFGSKEGFYKTVNSTSGSGNPYIFDTGGGTSEKPTLKMLRGATYSFDYSAATSHPLYFSSLDDGKHNSKAYSVYFDGTDDYLQISDSDDFNVGTGDFTLECFVNSEDNSNYQGVFGAYDYGANPILQISNAGLLRFVNDGSVIDVTGKTDLHGTGWHHIVMCRSGTTLRGFVDGREEISTTYSAAIDWGTASNGAVIGAVDRTDYPGQYQFKGYISNFRLVKGTALYTSNFTPPQTSLEAVTNTQLLCCQTNVATNAIVTPGTITANGGAAATNSHNPFVYSTNGYHGVNTATSNITKFTVPHLAADTLYYYCANHSGMGNSISVTTDETKADQYAWKNVLSLPLVGNSYDISDDINCTSTAKAISENGSPTATIARSNFYNGSYHFDSDSLESPDNDDFDLSFNDWTIEAWVYHSSTNFSSFEGIIGQWVDSSGSNRGWILETVGSGTTSDIEFYYYDTGNNFVGPIQGGTLQKEKWYHIAACRSGNTIRMFIDGVMYGSGTSINVSIKNSTNNLTVGGKVAGSGYWNGYIQDVRVYNGVAKYTENFSPASTDPAVQEVTPSGVSNPFNLTKIAEGAVAIEKSSSSYLDAPASSDFRLDGEFCIEFFAKLNDYSNDSVYPRTFVLDGASGDGGSNNIHLNINPSTGVILFWNGSGERIAGTIPFSGGWHHVALTREGVDTIRLFVDGKLSGTDTLSTDFNPNGGEPRPRLGGLITGSNGRVDGYFSNWRIVKGSAVYTKEFKPPTEPLIAIGGTKLLACQSNTSATAAAVMPTPSSDFTGGTALTWASSPIGSKWTLSNGDKNATSSGGSGYTGADVFSVALAANTTYAWTLDVTNGDSTGGWYFADVQSNTGTHADQKGGNSLGLRGAETQAGYYGTFASANSGSDGENKITMNSDVSPNGNKSIDFVVYRPASGTGKVWVKANTASTWIGGGDPSNTSSTATFIIPDGTTYFGFIDYDSSDTTTCNMRGNGDITLPPFTAHGNAVATNLNPFNTNINTVRGQETGYATMNSEDSSGSGTLSDGNLKWHSAMASHMSVRSTLSMRTGKWYAEATVLDNANTVGSAFGIALNTANLDSYIGDTGGWSYHFNGNKYLNGDGGSSFGVAYGSTKGNVVGLAFNADDGTLDAYLNGVYQGRVVDGLAEADYFWAANAFLCTWGFNFGQKPFKFPPPDGFQSLSAAALIPENVITRPGQYVGVTTYTGNGSNQSITTGFKPDLVWAKSSNTGTTPHLLVDSVRGVNKTLSTHTTGAEDDYTSINGVISSFNRDGFDTGANSDIATNGRKFVTWNWKAGGNKGTFNVDDVGYANASDVGMAVGDQNSSGYNTSQTWSNDLSALAGSSLTNPPNGFNGDPDDYADSTNGWSLDLSGHTFGSGSHPIEVKSGGATSFSVNGTTSLTDPGGGGAKVWYGTHTGEINTITSSATGASVYYVKIDGKILVNTGTNLSGLTQYPSIAPTGCSVGTKQGFSIIKYTGTLTGTPGSGSMPTVPHGLQKKPSFVIAKATVKDASHDGGDWFVWHHSTSLDFSLDLNLGAAGNAISSQGGGNMVAPNTSVFSTPYLSGINAGTGSTYIAYFWHDVPGLQKFGKYDGNSSIDGPFIELGFRPALFVMKQTDSTGYWMVYDSSRDLLNDGSPNYLFWNDAAAEGSGYDLDFLSNGVKLRTSNANFNTTSYVYAAWAEAPAFNLFGAQSNAR